MFLADRIFQDSCEGRATRKKFWLEGGREKLLDHRTVQLLTWWGFPGCEDIFCTWVLPECVSHYLCVRLSEASELKVSKAELFIFPKSAPALEYPILTNDVLFLAFCMSQNPQLHPFLTFFITYVQSISKFHLFCLINFTCN